MPNEKSVSHFQLFANLIIQEEAIHIQMLLSKSWFSLVTPRNMESLGDVGSNAGDKNGRVEAGERWEQQCLQWERTLC